MKRITDYRLLITEKGFTLVEVLVTILIIGIIGYMLSDILVKSLNNGHKSEIIGTVKQDAQNALNKMSVVIRDADVVTCPTTNGAIIGLLGKDGNYTRFRFYPQSGSANGYITEDFPGSSASIPPAQSVNLCDGTTYPPVGEVTLTNQDTINGVSISTGQFTVVPALGGKASVIIRFNASNGVSSGTGYQNTLLTPVLFETTVQLR